MPRRKALHLYGRPSEERPLDWAWVEEQLAVASTYWLVGIEEGRPHARPVWGVWHGERLHLSVGSPTLRRALDANSAVTVHLDSGTDVVIIDGLALPGGPTGPEVVAAYDRKYEWSYDVGERGELTPVAPVRVLAWWAAGPAGRDGFRRTGAWVFDPPE